MADTEASNVQPLKAFVGGLAPVTTDNDLRQYFSQFGPLDEVCVMREKVSGRSRGFAFLTFLDADVLNKVLDTPIHMLNDRMVEVKRAIPRGEVKSKARKLFVGGISPSSTAESLRAYFEQFGPIAETQIMKDRVRARSRGFGFVTFEDEESVPKVLALNEHILDGKHVDVKKAEPKRNTIPSIHMLGPLAPSGHLPATNGSPRGSLGYAPVLPTYAYAFMPYPFMGNENYPPISFASAGYADAPAGYFLTSPYTSPRGSFAIPLEADLPQDFAELSIGSYRRMSHDFAGNLGNLAAQGAASVVPLSPPQSRPSQAQPAVQPTSANQPDGSNFGAATNILSTTFA